jgi:hypothetical protein
MQKPYRQYGGDLALDQTGQHDLAVGEFERV